MNDEQEKALNQLPINVREKVRQLIESGTNFIGIGFWKSAQFPDFPDPRAFVDENWDKNEKKLVINYLKSGYKLMGFMGKSWCRFDCKNVDMGSYEITDGTYVWPEGLVHYIEKHNVRLPNEFIQHIKKSPHIDHSKLKNPLLMGVWLVLRDLDWWKSCKVY